MIKSSYTFLERMAAKKYPMPVEIAFRDKSDKIKLKE
jgi:hypothetical protein